MTKVQIYNDRNEPINLLVDKKEAHSKGLWHRVFICILINKKTKSIILQKKIQNKYNFDRPDYLDISVGGHYDNYETIEEGVREIREEIGLNPDFSELISLGVRQNSVILGENYYNREFQHIFAYVVDDDLENINFNFTDGEVTALVELNIDNTINLLQYNSNVVNSKILKFQNGDKEIENIEITRNDFVPDFLKFDQFMLRLFVAGRRILNNDKEIIFW